MDDERRVSIERDCKIAAWLGWRSIRPGREIKNSGTYTMSEGTHPVGGGREWIPTYADDGEVTVDMLDKLIFMEFSVQLYMWDSDTRATLRTMYSSGRISFQADGRSISEAVAAVSEKVIDAEESRLKA